ENELVRDEAIVASVEFRVPLLFNKSGAGIVHLAPFFDYGAAQNIRFTPEPTSIYSAGLGLLLAPCNNFDPQLYWGYQLSRIATPPDEDAQDLGLHFRINIHAL